MVNRAGDAVIGIGGSLLDRAAFGSGLDLAQVLEGFADVDEVIARHAGGQFLEQGHVHAVAEVADRGLVAVEELGDERGGNAFRGGFGIGAVIVGDDAVIPAGVLISGDHDLRAGEEALAAAEESDHSQVMDTVKAGVVQPGRVSQVRGVGDHETVNFRIGLNELADFGDVIFRGHIHLP